MENQLSSRLQSCVSIQLVRLIVVAKDPIILVISKVIALIVMNATKITLFGENHVLIGIFVEIE